MNNGFKVPSTLSVCLHVGVFMGMWLFSDQMALKSAYVWNVAHFTLRVSYALWDHTGLVSVSIHSGLGHD